MVKATVILVYLALLGAAIYLIPTEPTITLQPTLACSEMNTNNRHAFKCAHCFTNPPNTSQLAPITLHLQTQNATLFSINSCQKYTCQEMLQTIDSDSAALSKEELDEVRSFLQVLKVEEEKVSDKTTTLKNSKSWVLLTQTAQLPSSKILHADASMEDRLRLFESILYSISVMVIVIATKCLNSDTHQSMFLPLLMEGIAFLYFFTKSKTLATSILLEELLVVSILSYFLLSLDANLVSRIFAVATIVIISLLYASGAINEQMKSYLVLITVMVVSINPIKRLISKQLRPASLIKVMSVLLLASFYMIYSITQLPLCLIAILWTMHSSIAVIVLMAPQDSKRSQYSNRVATADNIEIQELTQL